MLDDGQERLPAYIQKKGQGLALVPQMQAAKRDCDFDYGTQGVLLLHLQDSLESGPTWCLHESGAERDVVGGCCAAEEAGFVLFACQYW